MDTTRDAHLELALRLRTARELAGLSQGQVARVMGIPRPSVSEIEAGRRKVSAEELRSFAQVYSVSSAWLLNDSDDDPDRSRIELAARELSKLSGDDVDRLLRLLSALR